MNARMVITVPIELVPQKVYQILSEVSDNLNQISSDIHYTCNDIREKKYLLEHLQTLDSVRKKLANLDLNIEDCYNVMKGYINYQYELQESQQESKNDTSDEGSSS